MKWFLPFLLFGCASFHPGPIREVKPVIQRGWAYTESEKDFLNLESGVNQVSYSGAQIAGEKVVFGSDRFGIAVLSKKNGQVIWHKKLRDGVTGLPYVTDKHVYVGAGSGKVFMFDLANGKEVWSVDLSAPMAGTFLLSADHLYVATDDEAIRALDANTGKILWSYKRPTFSGTSIRGGGNPSLVSGRLWMGFSDGTLVALNPQDGAVVFEKIFRDNVKFMDIDARVIGWREGILVSTYDGKLRYLRKDGSTIWEFNAGGARAPLIAEGDRIYFPSTDGNIYALSSNGKVIWNYFPKRGIPTGVAMLQTTKAKVLLVSYSENKLLALDMDSGKILGEHNLSRSSGSYSNIAVDSEEKSFYVLSNFSRLYKFYLNL